MKTKLINLWGTVTTSFWLIPLLLILASVVAAGAFVYADQLITIRPEGLYRLFYSGSADGTRTVLSTIAGSMMTVAGIVFSITVVSLTLASSQFGPRLLRNFMKDKLNQFVLGAYVASFIYCLLVLRTVKVEADLSFIPNLSVTFAIFLAVANIFLLIWFIHHISTSIQADQVIAKVNGELLSGIRRLFPDELGEEKDPKKKTEQEALEQLKKKLPHQETLLTTQNSNYLQAIDNDSLLAVAREHDLLLTLDHRPGDYLIQDTPLINIHSEAPCSQEVKDRLTRAFTLGKSRTPVQDAEFAIHQLVEIAARALSPGVNDPFTALTCIDNLGAAMCYLCRSVFPSAYRYDDSGTIRIVTSPLTFSGMMDAAFNQIRQYGKGSAAVIIRLAETLHQIHEVAHTQEQKTSIKRHAAMLLRAGETSLTEPNDLDDLKERLEVLTT